MARGSHSNTASSRPSTASPCVAEWRDSVPPAPHSCSGWGTGCARSRPTRWTISGTTRSSPRRRRRSARTSGPSSRESARSWTGRSNGPVSSRNTSSPPRSPWRRTSRRSAVATRAAVALTLPVPPAGAFDYQVYVGPLEYRRLSQLGHDLDDANPYGGFLQPIIQPVSVLVVNILVRLLLWPLNQRAMESSIRMQAVAPLLKQVQERYKNEPERLQREMMKLYKEHNVNPFGGCLPMLLPMPVLFALFFVFANTIEFRGVAFLWLPDLSRPDPYYIIPIVMGLSMFVLSKVGQIGMPPNPQTKMMLYFMPAFLTLLFLNFASGLNLYYAVSNIFSIPQQYLIARRRLRDQGKKT